MDAHTASCTLVVLDAKGKQLTHRVVETNGQTLVEALRDVAGTKHLCLEEGTHASWLFEILRPHVATIVVEHVTQSRGPKSDAKDAHALAERLRTGGLGPRVFKDTADVTTLRQLVKAPSMIVGDTVRCMNRVSALYRSRGLPAPGKKLYGMSMREEVLGQLPVSSRQAAETLFAAYDGLSEVRELAGGDVVREVQSFAVTKTLLTCPGLGPLRVAHLLATVNTPDRFRTCRQFWSYCGLGIVTRSSSDWVRDTKGDWGDVIVAQHGASTERERAPR